MTDKEKTLPYWGGVQKTVHVFIMYTLFAMLCILTWHVFESAYISAELFVHKLNISVAFFGVFICFAALSYYMSYYFLIRTPNQFFFLTGGVSDSEFPTNLFEKSVMFLTMLIWWSILYVIYAIFLYEFQRLEGIINPPFALMVLTIGAWFLIGVIIIILFILFFRGVFKDFDAWLNFY